MNLYTLEDLIWAIEAENQAKKRQFSVKFARCNYDQLRDELIKQLSELSKITKLELSSDHLNLYYVIKDFVKDQNIQALMVYGWENIENLPEFLALINQLREKFRDEFNFPVIFWVNDFIISQFETYAKDFQNWGVSLSFPVTAEAVKGYLEEKIDSFFNGILEAGGSRFLTNEDILSKNYQNEIEAAINDLKVLGEDLNPELLGSLELIKAREYQRGKNININLALEYLNKCQEYWQIVGKNVRSPLRIDILKQAVLKINFGSCYFSLLKDTHEISYLAKAKSNFQASLDYFQECEREDLTAKFVNLLQEVLLHSQQWQELETLSKKVITIQEKYNYYLELAQSYSFLGQIAIAKSDWKEAIDQLNLALNTLTNATIDNNKFARIYYLLLAKAQENLGQHQESINNQEKAFEIKFKGKPFYALQLLEELRQLYFKNKHFLDAYKIKLKLLSLRQQYGITAFVGAGRIQASQTEKFSLSGRQINVTEIIDKLTNPKNKLTIIYGQSGVGKSSLIEGGLIPALQHQKLIDNRDIVISYLRGYRNWIEDLSHNFKIDQTSEVLKTSEVSKTQQILEKITDNSNNYQYTILIFDQFEEFFFYWDTPEKRKEFFQFFQECLELNFVKIILSLREDYLYLLLQGTRNLDLSRINNDILDRDILSYIGNFSKPDAVKVIQELTEKSQFKMEIPLIEQFVEDLSQELDEVRPIELQIVGTQLQQEKITTLSKYRSFRQNSPGKLVHQYLDDVINDCGEENKDIASLVLSLLIDEKNDTRPLKTRNEIEEALEKLKFYNPHPFVSSPIRRGESQLDLVLNILVLSGLVMLIPEKTKISEKPVYRYQLVHDYLVEVIRQKQETSLYTRLIEAQEEIEREKQETLKWIKWLKIAVVGLIIGLLGLAGVSVLAFKYAFKANNQEIMALSNSANAYHVLNPQLLDSLLEALKAGINIQKNRAIIKSDNQRLVRLMLNQAIYDGLREKNRLEGHQNGINSVVFSPDGNTLASASEDKTVKLWSKEGKLLHTLEGHQGRVNSVAFIHDGNTIASASGDGTIKLWSKEGKLLRTIPAHQDIVISVAFAPDGNTIASGGGDGTIKLWNKEGKLLQTLQAHQDRVNSVAFSADGKMIASAGGFDDKTIKLWSREGKLLHILEGHQSWINSVVFAQNDNTLASASYDGTIKLWSRKGKLLHTLQGHQGRVHSVAFAPDGKTIASASDDKTIKLWSQEGKLLQTLQGHQDMVYSVAFAPDGKTIASAGDDKTIKLWSQEGKLLQTLQDYQNPVYSIAFAPDGKVIASGGGDGTIKLWNKEGELLHTLPAHQDMVYSVAFAPDGKAIASGGGDGTIKLWSREGKLLHTISAHQGEVSEVAFAPDGETIISVSYDKTIKLWSKEGKLIYTLESHQDWIYSVAFAPDGNTFASASIDGTIKVWSKKGKLLYTLQAHQSAVFKVAFSPDGNTLASASGDKTIKLWSKEGKLLHTLQGHQNPVYSVVFSPDGNTLASASGDNTVKLWSKEGKLLHTFEGHQDAVFSVVFSPDGNTIVSASSDKTIKLWNLNLDELVKEGCDWVIDYLNNSADVSKEDKTLCDDVYKVKK